MNENCDIRDVYDSRVSRQGGREITPALNFIRRNNRFDTYGMAAFEYRDRMTINGVFQRDVCKNAGRGFATSGEELPRNSEIRPQPIDHHIFL